MVTEEIENSLTGALTKGNLKLYI